MKDLGVIFDSKLNFVQHCKEKINTAYSYLGIIKRNFIYLDEDAFVMLYKSLVRSHLEYANSVWNRDAPIIGIGRLSAVLPIIGIGRLLRRYRPIIVYSW